MHGHQPHPATPGGATEFSTAFRPNPGKKRGSYNCGRCGLPKKGHSCHLPPSTASATPTDSTSSASAASPLSAVRPPPPPRQPYTQLRRALSFDDIDVPDSPESDDEEEEDDVTPEMDTDFGSGKLPSSCLWEVLRRLPPPALLSAAKVCKGWRDTSRRLWRAAEELRLRVPARAQIGFAGSVVQKCPGLLRLSLRMERLGFSRSRFSSIGRLDYILIRLKITRLTKLNLI